VLEYNPSITSNSHILAMRNNNNNIHSSSSKCMHSNTNNNNHHNTNSSLNMDSSNHTIIHNKTQKKHDRDNGRGRPSSTVCET